MPIFGQKCQFLANFGRFWAKNPFFGGESKTFGTIISGHQWDTFLVLKTLNEAPNRDWHFGFETSRFRDFCHRFEGFGYGEFGIGKKVSVSVSKKKSQFWFRKAWSRKKSFSFCIREFGPGKMFCFRKIWSQKKSRFWFWKLGLGKEKIKVTRKNLDQVNSPSLYLNSNLFCFVPIY